MRGSEQPSSFVPANDPASGQWFWIDVPALARAAGLPLDTPLVEARRVPEPLHLTQGLRDRQSSSCLLSDREVLGATCTRLWTRALGCLVVTLLRVPMCRGDMASWGRAGRPANESAWGKVHAVCE